MSFVRLDGRAGHVVTLARARFGIDALPFAEAHRGEDLVGVPRELLLELLAFFRDDPDLALGLLLDITCVDRHQERSHEDEDEDEETSDAAAPERFLIVYRLKSPRLGYRARVLVEVSEHDAVVPSVSSLYPAADWLERELWDLFGVYPDGHPNLRRLMLYEGFSGHPLRRDYPASKAQPLVPLRELIAPAIAPEPADTDDEGAG